MLWLLFTSESIHQEWKNEKREVEYTEMISTKMLKLSISGRCHNSHFYFLHFQICFSKCFTVHIYYFYNNVIIMNFKNPEQLLSFILNLIKYTHNLTICHIFIASFLLVTFCLSRCTHWRNIFITPNFLALC